MITPQQLKEYIKPVIVNGKYDWNVFEKQIQQESNWEHYRPDGSIKMSYTGSSAGVGQLNKSYYPIEIWSDPFKNITAAANTAIANLNKFGTYRKALAAYNWGPGNVGGYTDAVGRLHPAWDGTRSWRCPQEAVVASCRTLQRDHYLDAILGLEWKEPAPMALSEAYNVGPGVLARMQEYNDSPATHELYFNHSDGSPQYSITFGKSGAQYTYIFSLNQTFRFLAD